MKLTLKETAMLGMLGSLMYALKAIMEILPNIHLLGTFIAAITVVYRKKALYPIYVFVLINGFVSGFAAWWVPYLYVWTVLWGAVMLLPKEMPEKIKPFVYAVICALHGLLFGILYAPVQALFFGLDFEGAIAWIISGFPFDLIHCISNLLCGMLICPIVKVLSQANKYTN